MNAERGDWLVVEPPHVGEHGRRGLIVDVRDPAGAPPYLVRWVDTDHETLVFPGPTSRVEKAEHAT